MNIVISGNIGVGKTTLTEKLSSHYGWQPSYEDISKNPYLDDFYMEMERWSFNLQIYFLRQRFEQSITIQNSNVHTIQDRSLYEDAHIFASNLNSMGLMSDRDYQNYLDLFNLMGVMVKSPTLMIYLRSGIDNIQSNIIKRGRVFEKSISTDYLRRLNERYEAWIYSYKESEVLIIDVNQLDFISNPLDLKTIIHSIDTKLSTLSVK